MGHQCPLCGTWRLVRRGFRQTGSTDPRVGRSWPALQGIKCWIGTFGLIISTSQPNTCGRCRSVRKLVERQPLEVLDGVEELAHRVLGVSEEEGGVLLEEELVLDSREAGSHGALHEHDLLAFVGVEDLSLIHLTLPTIYSV